MGFVKVQKTKAYFKRYQVKYRRRRDGKTDYVARRALVVQDRNKYNTPKYRMVVRITNSDVIAQMVSAKIIGDSVLAAAYAHELPRYGLKHGLTNYAATYCVGLLLARRVLNKLKLDDKYSGATKIDGSDYNVEALESGPRPFKCFMDVGLVRTSTGARVFAALKGALDGGLNIPHTTQRFVGGKKDGFDAKVLRKYIFGGHVADYMKKLKEDDEEAFKRQFSRYLKDGVKPEDLEKTYQAVHKAIRANPVPALKEKKFTGEKKRFNAKRLTLAERKARVQKKKDDHAKAKAAAAQ